MKKGDQRMSQLTSALKANPRIVVYGDYLLINRLYLDDEPAFKGVRRVKRCVPACGASAQIACYLNALGATSVCIGVLGDDGYGMELKRLLDDAGTDISMLYTTLKRCTDTLIEPLDHSKTYGMLLHEQEPFPARLQVFLEQYLKTVVRSADALIAYCAFTPNTAVNLPMRKHLSSLALQHVDVPVLAAGSIPDWMSGISMIYESSALAHHWQTDPAHISSWRDAAWYAQQVRAATGKPTYVLMDTGGIGISDPNVYYKHAIPSQSDFKLAQIAGIVFANACGLSTGDAAVVGNAMAYLVAQRNDAHATVDLPTLCAFLTSPDGACLFEPSN